MKTIDLPGQARDKHRERALTNDAFEYLNWAEHDRGQRPGKDEKTPLFARHLYIKTIILPRQARDKHRESAAQNKRVMRFYYRRAPSPPRPPPTR
jgi:hypothetical protein